MNRTIFFLTSFWLVSPGLSAQPLVDESYTRNSGSPTTHTLEISLDSAAELRILNGGLTDDAVDLAASTSVVVDGVNALTPFHLEPGAAYVLSLDSGFHIIKTTLHGKPGGHLDLFVNSLDGDVQETGYEVLPDGTVLDKSTGLVWHRNPITPGRPDDPWVGNLASAISYLDELNSGLYGVDPMEGNAGKSDWRLPTMKEIESLMDYRFSNPVMHNESGGGTIYPEPRNGDKGGHQFGQPFYICPWGYRFPGDPEAQCQIDHVNIHGWGRFWPPTPATTTLNPNPSSTRTPMSRYFDDAGFYRGVSEVWAVRDQ